MKQTTFIATLLLLLTANTSHAQGLHWSPTNGPEIVGSHVSTVSADNTLYAQILGSIHAIYSSTDLGLTWKTIPAVGSLHPTLLYDIRVRQDGMILVSSNAGLAHYTDTITRTRNGGATWDSVEGSIQGWPTLPSMAWFRNGDVVRACWGCYEVSISHDTCKTWKLLTLPNQISQTEDRAVTVNGNDDLFVLAGTGNLTPGHPLLDTVYKSADEGSTWSIVYASKDTGDFGTQMFSMPDGSLCIIREIQSNMTGSILFSDPSGTVWGTQHTLPLGWYTSLTGVLQSRSRIAAAPNGNLLLLADSIIVRTKDRGVSWDTILLPEEPYYTFTSIVIDSNGAIVISGDSGIFVFTDQGWVRRILPHSMVNSLAVAPSGTVLAICGWEDNMYGTHNSVTLTSTDKGETWVHRLPGSGLDQLDEGLFPYPRDTGWTASVAVDTSGKFLLGMTLPKGSYPFRSVDDGSTWDALPSATAGLGFLVVDKEGAFWSNNPYVEHTTDEGSTWDELSTGITNQNITCLAIAPNGNPFAGSQGTIFRNEQGPAWEKLATGQHGSFVTSIAIDSNSIIYASTGNLNHPGTSNEGVLRSKDNGDSWQFINSGLPANISINQLIVLPLNVLVAATAKGIFSLRSGQTSWSFAGDGLLDNDILSLAYRDSLFYAGSAHEGVFRANITGFAAVNPQLQASTYLLQQNYPNPFNPTTTISYSLPRAEAVTLSIRDVLGNVRMKLVEGLEGAGGHSVTMNASQLPSGVYFYTLESASGRSTRRMVVAK